MKKSGLIIAGIVVIGMSGLSNMALSVSEDSHWTPYDLRWNQKLPVAKNKKLKRKSEPITICSLRTDRKVQPIQR
jgi:hypothetical protein